MNNSSSGSIAFGSVLLARQSNESPSGKKNKQAEETNSNNKSINLTLTAQSITFIFIFNEYQTNQ